MRECSAFCNPEKGVHVFLQYAHAKCVDEAQRAWVGARGQSEAHSPASVQTSCVPRGVGMVVVDVQPAVEAPPSGDEFWHLPLLVTVHTT